MTKEKTFWDSRKALWKGIGTEFDTNYSAEEALRMAGLDWNVVQKDLYTDAGDKIDGFKANVKETDDTVLGIVSDKYSVIQNTDIFRFCNQLFKQGLKLETMGSFRNGRNVFVVMKLPESYFMNGDQINSYVVAVNSHDTSTSLRIFICPLRISCSNMLPLAMKRAQRSWSSVHAGTLENKLDAAKETLRLAENYMSNLGKEIHELQNKEISESKVIELVNELVPIPENASEQQKKNVEKIRGDILYRYRFAPDLTCLPNSAYRFLNSISDHICHSRPIRETKDYQTNLFQKMAVETHPLFDRAYRLSMAA